MSFNLRSNIVRWIFSGYIILLATGSGVAQCDNVNDYTALRALYLSTDGDNWNDNTGWPTASTFNTNSTPPGGTDMSGWYGVTCGANDRVTQISLLGNGLNGSLPFEIGDLSELEALNLNDNSLNGSIPTSIGSLTNLESILFFQNSFNGSIPSQLNSLTNLIALELSDNNFNGSIPDLSNLTLLSYLNISDNPLSTSIPSTIGDLSSLTFLILNDCNLSNSIPNELGNLNNLTRLELQNNSLDGCIPSELLGLCDNVTQGDISNNPTLETQSWSDFCTFQEGVCSNCPTEYIISYPTEACAFFDIDVTIFGGSPDFTVNLFEDGDLINPIASTTITGQTATFEVIAADAGTFNYYVTIEDGLGVLCEEITQLSGSEDITVYLGGSFGVGQPIEPTCQGEAFEISITGSGGMTPYSATLFENSTFIGTQEGNGPTFIFTVDGNISGDFDYSGSITDAIGCPYTVPLFIPPPHTILPAPIINDLEPINLCQEEDEMVMVDLTTYETDLSAENPITWYFDADDSFPIPNASTFMTAGSINVYARARGSNDCYSTFELVEIVLNTFTLICSSNESTINVTTENANLPLNISWSGNSSGSEESASSSYIIPDLTDGSYTIIVEDNLGCTEICMVEIMTIPVVCDHPDVANLIAFYNATNGEDWMNSTGWAEGVAGTNCDPCGLEEGNSPWYGISCDDLANRVVQIELENNSLTGSLILFNDLDSLKIINLSNNNIQGGQWNWSNEKIVSIDLSDIDSLNTTLPDFNLPNLEFLFAFNSGLTGELPSFNNVPLLREAYIYNNQFTGEIPNWQLDSLRGLSLFNCGLTGNLPDFDVSLKMIELFVDSNALTGPLLAYDHMVDLSTYAVRSNDLSGCFPMRDFCSFNWFTALNNPQLPFEGDYGPICVGETETGALCNDGIGIFDTETCSCLCNIAYVFNDITIDISESPLTSSMIMPESAACTLYFDPAIQDTILNLDCDQVNTTTTVFVFTESGQQVWFELTVTDVGDICNGLCMHPDYAALESFFESTNGDQWGDNTDWLSNCDPCGLEVGNSAWHGLQCENNRIVCIDMFGATTCGQVGGIVGPNNNLTGTLPEEISLLTELRFLDIQESKVGGPIPESISGLPKLEYLDLSENLFSGQLPENLDLLTNLVFLDVANCPLISTIPSEIVDLEKLQYFYANNCLLFGELPIGMDALNDIEWVDLSNNNLTGKIPVDLGDLNLGSNFYVFLDLSNNDLEGCIPESFENYCGFLPDVDLSNNPKLTDQGNNWSQFCNTITLEEQSNQRCGIALDSIINENCECVALETITVEVFEIVNTCSFSLSGMIDITFSGSETCTFSWTNIDGAEVSTDLDLVGVGPGTYTLLVTCLGMQFYTLTETVQELFLEPTIVSSDICDNAPINIFVQDTFDTYSWAIDGIPNSNDSNELEITDGGIYSITVTDGQGCVGSDVVTIINHTSPETGITQTVFEVCNNSNDGISQLSLVDIGDGNGSWTTNSMINISDLTNVDFDGELEGEYSFTFTTNTAIEPCLDVTEMITVNAISCSDCGPGSCLSENLPDWISDSNLVDITVSCLQDIPEPQLLSYSNNQMDDCEISGELMPSRDITSDFDGCAGFITDSWTYTTICGDIIVPYIRTITIMDGGILEFVDLPSATIDITCDDVNLLNIDLDYGIVQGAECIDGSTIQPTIIENYNECGGVVELTWAIKIDCYDELSFTQIATIEVNDIFEFQDLPSDITISCDQLPFEPVILVISNNPNAACAVEAEVQGVSAPEIADCPGIMVNTWTYANPCTNEQMSHMQTVTLVDCAPPTLENDYIEIRAGEIYTIDLFENDFIPDSISTQLIEIEREELYSAKDYESNGIFEFVIEESFFDTLNLIYEVCNLKCNICTTAKLQIVDEALKDIFLTDIITPDSDGMNDILKFNFETEISDAHLYIFNRWGSKIYEKIGYTNDWDASGYPGGVYYYVLRIGKAEIKKTLTVVK